MSPLLAQSGVLLLCIHMSGIGAEADTRRRLALMGCAASDPDPTQGTLLARAGMRGARAGHRGIREIGRHHSRRRRHRLYPLFFSDLRGRHRLSRQMRVHRIPVSHSISTIAKRVCGRGDRVRRAPRQGVPGIGTNRVCSRRERCAKVAVRVAQDRRDERQALIDVDPCLVGPRRTARIGGHALDRTRRAQSNVPFDAACCAGARGPCQSHAAENGGSRRLFQWTAIKRAEHRWRSQICALADVLEATAMWQCNVTRQPSPVARSIPSPPIIPPVFVVAWPLA